MVQDHKGEHNSLHAATQSIAAKIGCSGETLRNWIRQAESDKGVRVGPMTDERERIKALEREVRELRQANEIEAQGERVFCHGGARPPVAAMIAFIDDHREVHGVEPICRVLPIAPSTYHLHAARQADPAKLPPRAKSDAALKIEIRRVFEANFCVYGVCKVWRQLGREGIDIARCTVARLMRIMGLRGVVRGRKVRTTVPSPVAACPLDRVNRQFKAPRPNALWVSDFTYVATWVGFVYVAFVIDVFARRIVGWRVSRTAMLASCSTPWSRPCTSVAPSRAAVSCITATEVRSTSRCATPSGSSMPASNPPSAASATPMTTRSPRRSTASTRPR